MSSSPNDLPYQFDDYLVDQLRAYYVNNLINDKQDLADALNIDAGSSEALYAWAVYRWMDSRGPIY